jgi:N-methylhydantoinase B
MTSDNPIQLEIFRHLFSSIAEEMGVVLRRSSYSPNIKERRDFSCAVFDRNGLMVAQAAHIPVHLGSMPLSVSAALEKFGEDLAHGDAVILNDPYLGGTHLPDITLVSPVIINGQRVGLVATRAHHADVGGITPGSMPIAREIYQEGLIIPPIKLLTQGEINQAVFDFILANVRTPEERSGDLWAQIAANRRGVLRLVEMNEQYGSQVVDQNMRALVDYTKRMTRQLLHQIPDGSYHFCDSLDDDGFGSESIPICVTLQIKGDQAVVDFTGSAVEQKGSVNAVKAITISAVHYVIRCLIGWDIPNNAGCLVPIQVVAPEGTVVNARKPAPVAGGNVETSQRIVDVLLGALAQAAPSMIPAASQGTMNNITIGGWDCFRRRPFTYYETIGGGMGAGPEVNGPSAVHSHMTNTLNTPVEALEYIYPLRVLEYSIRKNTGGVGLKRGGNGIRRDILLLADAQVTLLTERRRLAPYGLAGGGPGCKGKNAWLKDGNEIGLAGKGSFEMKAGEIISIQTPGGGGWGSA